MRKLSIAALSAAAFAMAAAPAGAKQEEPGVPGTPGCQGQTTAYLAQVGKTIPNGKGGIGNLGKALGFTPRELHEFVRAFCADPPLPE